MSSFNGNLNYKNYFETNNDETIPLMSYGFVAITSFVLAYTTLLSKKKGRKNQEETEREKSIVPKERGYIGQDIGNKEEVEVETNNELINNNNNQVERQLVVGGGKLDKKYKLHISNLLDLLMELKRITNSKKKGIEKEESKKVLKILKEIFKIEEQEELYGGRVYFYKNSLVKNLEENNNITEPIPNELEEELEIDMLEDIQIHRRSFFQFATRFREYLGMENRYEDTFEIDFIFDMIMMSIMYCIFVHYIWANINIEIGINLQSDFELLNNVNNKLIEDQDRYEFGFGEEKINIIKEDIELLKNMELSNELRVIADYLILVIEEKTMRGGKIIKLKNRKTKSKRR